MTAKLTQVEYDERRRFLKMLFRGYKTNTRDIIEVIDPALEQIEKQLA
jgi:hypothetical protein